MLAEIDFLDKNFFRKLNLTLTNIYPDLECKDYLGYNFELNQLNIKFRKAKITPTKVGQFVTLWQRNAKGITSPFNLDDDFNFVIIYTEQNQQKGYFIFPKMVLADKGIISKLTKEGKRGFRVYPDWDIAQNTQAIKTQNWQKQYFITTKESDILKLAEILTQV